MLLAPSTGDRSRSSEAEAEPRETRKRGSKRLRRVATRRRRADYRCENPVNRAQMVSDFPPKYQVQPGVNAGPIPHAKTP